MSGYILCQVKRAKNPYYISNISTNIYSIEELCYYLYHNIYLLDETIINEQLLVWMKEELHLRRLYQRLYVLLEEKRTSVSLSCRSSRRSIIFPTISSVR